MVDGIKCGPRVTRCDVDGNVWVSSNGNPGGRALGYSGVTVWTPEGKRNRLFMAASQSLYALYVATQGAAPA
jgi:gluconolactonase